MRGSERPPCTSSQTPLERFGTLLDVDVHPVLHDRGERVPRLGEPTVEALAPPLTDALAHLVGREEHPGPGLGQRARRRRLLVGHTDHDLVHERGSRGARAARRRGRGRRPRRHRGSAPTDESSDTAS